MGAARINLGGQELLVDYDYSPPQAGVHTLRNGDPGWPDEPEEFYVTKIRLMMPNGSWLDVSDLLGELLGDSGDDLITTTTYAAMCAEAADWQEDRV